MRAQVEATKTFTQVFGDEKQGILLAIDLYEAVLLESLKEMEARKHWRQEWVSPASQYSMGLHSACTLLALEGCCRLQQGAAPSQALVLDVLRACADCNLDRHSSVTDILEGDLSERVKRVLRRVGSEQAQLGQLDKLQAAAAAAASGGGGAAVAVSIVITRPPETLAVHVPPGEGAALLGFAGWPELLAHLAALWPPVEGCGSSLQAQMLNLFEAHFFVGGPGPREPPPALRPQSRHLTSVAT